MVCRFNISGISFISTLLLLASMPAMGHSAPALLHSEKRLIQTGENEIRWMTPEEIAALSHSRHEQGRCGGYMDITDHQDLIATPVRAFDIEGRATLANTVLVQQLVKEVSAENLKASVTKLSSFPSRFYTTDSGLASATWIRDTFAKLAEGRSDVKVEFFQHKWKQPSVIARIQGTDRLAEEIVVLGAHQDSVNQGLFGPNPGKDAPGADDDASGVATLIETFRVLMASGHKPKRTIEFMAYAAEEVGLWGSQDIAKAYQKAGKKVMGVIQFDMTMYPSAKKEIVFISDFVDKNLTDYTKKLIDTYLQVSWSNDKCGYGCSDHASWTKAGFPSVMPAEAPFKQMNPNLHKTSDTTAHLDFEFGANFARLGLAYAVEMGSP